jgi:hypothetical protein
MYQRPLISAGPRYIKTPGLEAHLIYQPSYFCFFFFIAAITSLFLATATALHDEYEYPLSAESDQKFDKQRSKALNQTK